jgi:hypothetical protein
MSEIDLMELEARLDPRDREYVAGLEDAETRSTVVTTLLRYRRKEELAVGDAVPRFELFRLEDEKQVSLAALHERRPLVLVFGSFT